MNLKKYSILGYFSTLSMLLPPWKRASTLRSRRNFRISFDKSGEKPICARRSLPESSVSRSPLSANMKPESAGWTYSRFAKSAKQSAFPWKSLPADWRNAFSKIADPHSGPPKSFKSVSGQIQSEKTKSFLCTMLVDRLLMNGCASCGLRIAHLFPFQRRIA